MRLIFLYYSRGSRNHTNWDPNIPFKVCPPATQYTTDGYAYIGNRLIENGIVDGVLSFVETGRHFGHFKISDKHTVYAIPNIQCVEPLLKHNDVIFVRGAWKHWAGPLDKWSKHHWVLYYGAGTPRNHWSMWHMVFNDFLTKPQMGHRNIHPIFPFTKPINYNVFKPLQLKKEYDILLNGCFHVYDKKGQYLIINAAVEYKKLFGEHLKIAMPGGIYRNTYTSKMASIIKHNNLLVYQPGVIPREDLNCLINKCKLYVHVGYGEMNARSALESMRCGLPLYIANPKLWPKFVSDNPEITKICKNPNDPIQVAQDIHQLLIDMDTGIFGKDASQYFDQYNSPEITVKQFTQILEVMKNTKPNQNVLVEELVN
jgi:glycosyltransferase involved in cell wall biosynthesis